MAETNGAGKGRGKGKGKGKGKVGHAASANPPAPAPEDGDKGHAQLPIDYVVVGIGIPAKNKMTSRQNAGFILADYLANCVSMQSIMLKKAQEGAVNANPETAEIPIDYRRPVFIRYMNLHADVNDSLFSLTEADVMPSELGKGSDAVVARSHRVIIAKAHKSLAKVPQEAIAYIKHLVKAFSIKNPAKELIVAVEDMRIPRGSINIQVGGDVNTVQGHAGLARTAAALGTTNFIQLRIGIGKPKDMGAKPSDGEVSRYLLDNLSIEDREIDYFGYALDLCGQAIQHYIVHQDIALTSKKFNAERVKSVEDLRQLPGIVFPIELDLTIARAQLGQSLIDKGLIKLEPRADEAEADASTEEKATAEGGQDD